MMSYTAVKCKHCGVLMSEDSSICVNCGEIIYEIDPWDKNFRKNAPKTYTVDASEGAVPVDYDEETDYVDEDNTGESLIDNLNKHKNPEKGGKKSIGTVLFILAVLAGFLSDIPILDNIADFFNSFIDSIEYFLNSLY